MASPTSWRASRSSPPKAVDAALRLKKKAAKRPPPDDDAPKRPSTFPAKPRHIEGQLGLFGEPTEGGTQ